MNVDHRSRSAAGLLAWIVLVIGTASWSADGQSKTVTSASPGEPLVGLTDEEQDLHIRGRRLFRWELWRPDRAATGFNATECSKCHLEPTFGGSGKAKDEFAAFIPDQSSPSGWKAFHRFQRDEAGRFKRVQLPDRAEIRRAPSLFGAGLLELVPSSDLRDIADAGDINGDGVSGRSILSGDRPGRFGWKASVSSIDDFVIKAFKDEMGITMSPFTRQDFEGLGMSQIKAVAFYVRTLSPPRTGQLGTASKTAIKTFERLLCARCHLPSLQTQSSPIEALNRKKIAAYTDLLLHEMSDSGDLHRTGGTPSSTEFRTPPLWGLGEFGGPYWHDGSAETIEAAIMKHAGEASTSRSLFEKLNSAERKALIDFLTKI